MTYEFSIDILPVPKARPRFTRNGGCYTPNATAIYEQIVYAEAKRAGVEPAPKGTPVFLELQFFIPYPISFSKKRRTFAEPAVRPDLDNYTKCMMDGLNGVGWVDDAQVVQISARKRYADAAQVNVIIHHLVENAV